MHAASLVRVGSDVIQPRDLGVFIDSNVLTRSHIHRMRHATSAGTTLRCSAIHAPTDLFQMLVGSFAVHWLDYCNAALAGVLMTHLRRFQPE